MEIVVDQSNLSHALRLACRALSTRAPLPVLQNVLLAAESGSVTLTATDGEIGLVTTVSADVTRPGRTAAPARLLAEYAAQLPSEPVRLVLDGGRRRLRVTCGRFDASLSTADPDDFPVLPPADQSTALDLDVGQIRRAIERVAFAAARDDSRPILAAVLFELGSPGLTVAAADGFRLARAIISDIVGGERHLLVPARAVMEFGRLLVEAEAARRCSVGSSMGASRTLTESSPTRRALGSSYRQRAFVRRCALPGCSARMDRFDRLSLRLVLTAYACWRAATKPARPRARSRQ